MENKELFLYTEKTAGSDARRITAAVSSEAIDRDDEIVTAAAMKNAFPEFMKNPVILAAHTHRLADGTPSVIGRVLSWNQNGTKTYCEIEFSDTPLGLQYWSLYSGKFQKAFSIGFRSLKQEHKNINGKTVLVHTEIELYEISAVAVPANPEALSKSAKRRQDFINSKRGGKDKDAAFGYDMADYLPDYLADNLAALPSPVLARFKQWEEEDSKNPDFADIDGGCPGDILDEDDPFGCCGDDEKSGPDEQEDYLGILDGTKNAPRCPMNDFYSETGKESDDAESDSQIDIQDVFKENKRLKRDLDQKNRDLKDKHGLVMRLMSRESTLKEFFGGIKTGV